MRMSTIRAMRRSTWIVVGGVFAALLLAGGMSLDAIAVGDAELVSGDAVQAVDNAATADAANLPESASTEGLECGYVECEVELTVVKRTRTPIKGAPGGLVSYEIKVFVPAGAPGPVIIDSVIDDKFGDLSLQPFGCDLIGEEINPDDDDDCDIDTALLQLEPGDEHTNTVTVIGHVASTNTPASGQASATVEIDEPQTNIDITYIVLDSGLSNCSSGIGSDTITVQTGSTVSHCFSARNSGNTVLVGNRQSRLGETLVSTNVTLPEGSIDSTGITQTALAGTTVYTYEVEVEDEWGNIVTKSVDVTVIGE
jgi:hypothetical protein